MHTSNVWSLTLGALALALSCASAPEVPRLAGYGATVFLASVDHSDWRLPQCYYTDETVKTIDDFIGLANAAIARVSKLATDCPVSPEMRRPLGTVLYELFKNTHDWARDDRTGSPLLRSVRGLLFERHSWLLREIESAVVDSPALKRFLNHQGIVATDGRVRFIEISFFDSGIGLAERFRRDRWNPDIGVEEEFIACMECLQKHKTSSGQAHKGIGLYEVMSTLSQLKAFLRIRTGRLSLYRDFIELPFDPLASPDEASRLFDWSTCGNSPTSHAQVRGTLYTMLIPVLI